MTEKEALALDQAERELRLLLPPTTAMAAALDALAEPGGDVGTLLDAVAKTKADATGHRAICAVVLLTAIANRRRPGAAPPRPAEKARR